MGEAIDSEIKAFIVENFLFGQENGNLEAGQSLLDTGIIDSTGVLELVAFIEERYAISVADQELLPDNLDSIGKISEFVARKKSAQTQPGN